MENSTLSGTEVHLAAQEEPVVGLAGDIPDSQEVKQGSMGRAPSDNPQGNLTGSQADRVLHQPAVPAEDQGIISRYVRHPVQEAQFGRQALPEPGVLNVPSKCLEGVESHHAQRRVGPLLEKADGNRRSEHVPGPAVRDSHLRAAVKEVRRERKDLAFMRGLEELGRRLGRLPPAVTAAELPETERPEDRALAALAEAAAAGPEGALEAARIAADLEPGWKRAALLALAPVEAPEDDR